jgi:hypothetical protein
MKTLSIWLLLAASVLAHDNIPNFVAGPPTSVKDGYWDDPATWRGKPPKTDTDAVINHRVVLRESASVLNINVTGTLAFEPAASASLKVQTLAILDHGTLEVGTPELPIVGSAEIVFRDLPLNLENDPETFGNGLLALSGSRVSIYGDGNITLRSENPAGVRGHTLYTGASDIRIHGATFADLGRTLGDPLDSTTFNPDHSVAHIGTNQVGRYAVHLHHLQGLIGTDAEYQCEVVNCSILRSRKWSLAIHDTHWGLIADNLIDGARGAGIAIESGNEYANVITRNTVRNIIPGTDTNPDRNAGGAGIWGRAASNDITDNTISDCHTGISLWCRIGARIPLPAYRGVFTDLPFHNGKLPSDGGAWPAVWAGYEDDVIGGYTGRQFDFRCAGNTILNPTSRGMFIAGCGDPRTGTFVTPIDSFIAESNTILSTNPNSAHLRVGIDVIYSGNIRLSGQVSKTGFGVPWKTNHPERIHDVDDFIWSD